MTAVHSEKRPLGISILGWFLVSTGVLVVGYELGSVSWNNSSLGRTHGYIGPHLSLPWLPFLYYSVQTAVGLGLLKRQAWAYVLVFFLLEIILYACGKGLVLDRYQLEQPVLIGLVLGGLLLFGTLCYLGKNRVRTQFHISRRVLAWFVTSTVVLLAVAEVVSAGLHKPGSNDPPAASFATSLPSSELGNAFEGSAFIGRGDAVEMVDLTQKVPEGKLPDNLRLGLAFLVVATTNEAVGNWNNALANYRLAGLHFSSAQLESGQIDAHLQSLVCLGLVPETLSEPLKLQVVPPNSSLRAYDELRQRWSRQRLREQLEQLRELPPVSSNLTAVALCDLLQEHLRVMESMFEYNTLALERGSHRPVSFNDDFVQFWTRGLLGPGLIFSDGRGRIDGVEPIPPQAELWSRCTNGLHRGKAIELASGELYIPGLMTIRKTAGLTGDGSHSITRCLARNPPERILLGRPFAKERRLALSLCTVADAALAVGNTNAAVEAYLRATSTSREAHSLEPLLALHAAGLLLEQTDRALAVASLALLAAIEEVHEPIKMMTREAARKEVNRDVLPECSAAAFACQLMRDLVRGRLAQPAGPLPDGAIPESEDVIALIRRVDCDRFNEGMRAWGILWSDSEPAPLPILTQTQWESIRKGSMTGVFAGFYLTPDGGMVVPGRQRLQTLLR